ncbi:hypothetical protein [Rathayibacter toxicus]|uniref:hypothetical protein n=1 Tax=Rathayibacter toxicus TaxID=145458 RepID=UPI0011B01248|nr:hypothetical protein [Rathayibacter toxicus]QOD11277.1 hypothetical protein BSG36_04880 [Rathayibacter toxicus]QWL28020.1 hypothetical protein E2R33_04895 [Rathayibacter toxicus]QWL32218.1 hypothetical protein E2R35_04760 [Rathayibacter toxicus]QWL34311.1 hypothetical protein E2R36_04760 [Rathayibacter toxicus]QWL36444.1 hypothetical protein E2R37_04760 [Rathayibacter toxicus]
MSQMSTSRESRWGRPRTRAGFIVFTAALVLLLPLSAPHSAGEKIAPTVLFLAGILFLALIPRSIPPAHGSWLRVRLAPRSATGAFYLELGVGIVGSVLSTQSGSSFPSIVAAVMVAVLGVVFVLIVHSEKEASYSQ